MCEGCNCVIWCVKGVMVCEVCNGVIMCEGCNGATDVSPGPGDVHPVWHCRVLNPHHVHEESGHLAQGQEEQETGQHLSSKE